MFINTVDYELTRADGSVVNVSLRLNVLSQIQLKKRWNEGTTETLFNAVDDIERFVDVLGKALNYIGNKNEIKDGAELVDLMAANGLLGMAEKQRIITSIGAASGIFSQKERDAIDKRAGAMFDGAFDDDEGDSKN